MTAVKAIRSNYWMELRREELAKERGTLRWGTMPWKKKKNRLKGGAVVAEGKILGGGQERRETN